MSRLAIRREHLVTGLVTGISLAALGCLCASLGHAHGFAGKRFFPTTFQIEDPFVADEFSVLSSLIKEPAEGGEPAVRAWETSAEYSKRITPRFGISIEGEFRRLDPKRDGPTRSGFGNLGIGAKYQFFTSERHETVASLGVEAEVGHTGGGDVEATPFWVLSPGLFIGHGFGELPESLNYLRPLAVTTALSVAIPTDSETRNDGEIARNPDMLAWGFSLQYNLAYLNSFVHATNLPAILNRIIPVVEVALDTCLDRGCSRVTTGTVNPGLLYVGRQFQVGAAAQIPINDRTGKNVGALLLVHIFLDDLFPKTLGKPLFGG